MKKIFLSGIPIFAIMFSISFLNSPSQAACPQTFLVGSETVYGCSAVTNNPEIEGFSIDVDNDKITLNNYHGGGIYFFCHASCSPTKSMEIELIGENTIDSELSASAPQEIYIPEKIDAGFINIFPTFTGTGNLNIKAATPFTFENKEFIHGLKVTSDDSQASLVTLTNSQNTANASDENEENKTDAEEIEIEEETEAINEVNPDSISFFDTTLGIVLLIAIPSVLLIIILILTILLIREKRAKNANNNINTPNVIDTNQQPQINKPNVS